MGNCVSMLKRKKEPNKPVTLAIIGVDNAGKTTLCSVFSGETPDPDIAPTVGFRNIKFSHSNFDITVFDVGGGKNIRPIWKNYFGEVYGVMYVLDSSSPKRLKEARDVFRDALEHPQISGKPVLILANKVDIADHMDELDIVKGLRLDETAGANNCPSRIVMVSALAGVGNKMDKELQQGLQWLLDTIRSSLSALEPRVQDDMRMAKEARDKEREERRARVKKQRDDRNKEEEAERKRLGLDDKDGTDEEDIVDGDPFKTLDLAKLTEKEQRLKNEKRKKQERLQHLDDDDRNKKWSKDDTSLSYTADRNFGKVRSRDLESYNFDKGEKSSLHMGDEDKYSTLSMFGRNNRLSALPPLEPLGSRAIVGSLEEGDRKKPKKKKKLSDYQLDSPEDNALKQRNETIERLGLNIHEPMSWNRDADHHDLTPRVVKPKKNSVVKAGRIEEDEEEDDDKPYGYRDIVHQRNRYNEHSNLGSSQRQKRYDNIYPSVQSSRSKDDYSRSHREREEENSIYHKSLRKISPPNLNRFDEDDDDDKDEGIEEDSDNSDTRVDKRYSAQRNAYNVNSNGKAKHPHKSDREKVRRHLSDDENDDFLSRSILKDTMRFPASPSDEDMPKDYRKEIEKLRQRQKQDQSRGYHGIENGGYSGYKSRDYNDHEDSDSHNTRNYRSRDIYSPDEDEERIGRTSDRSDTRRKKKKNLLRSNKLAPSDDDDIETSAERRFTNPRLVQEHGSRNTSEADTPSKGRKATHFHRNISQDSDLGAKWGLAEDLPAIDDNYGARRFRHPNFDDSDGGEVIF